MQGAAKRWFVNHHFLPAGMAASVKITAQPKFPRCARVQMLREQ